MVLGYGFKEVFSIRSIGWCFPRETSIFRRTICYYIYSLSSYFHASYWVPLVDSIQFEKPQNQIHESVLKAIYNAKESIDVELLLLFFLSQDDDSPCHINHSSCNIVNQLVDIESFNNIEPLNQCYYDHLISYDFPSCMDKSLFSQEDLDLHNFQLESHMIIEEFLLGISIPTC